MGTRLVVPAAQVGALPGGGVGRLEGGGAELLRLERQQAQGQLAQGDGDEAGDDDGEKPQAELARAGHAGAHPRLSRALRSKVPRSISSRTA